MDLSKTKSLILHGQSGTGKTELAKSIVKHIGKKPVLIRDINILGHENINTDTGLIFDDISLRDVSREVKIHHLDTENESQIRVLYKVVRIPKNTIRIFTTNVLENLVCEPFSNSIPSEIARRVSIVEIKKCMQIDVEKTTTVVENYKISLKFKE